MSPSGVAPETIIAGNDGAVNAGEGAQYNGSTVHNGTGDMYFFEIAEHARFAMDERGRLRRPRTVVTSRRLEDLRARYVAPPGYDEEEQRQGLDEYGVLVLTGPAGVGRRTAAQLTLIPQGWERKTDLREVQVEADPRPVLDAGEVQSGERLMVDLTGPTTVAELRRDLLTLTSQVQAAGAWLVLLMERDDVRDLPDDLRERTVDLRRPDGATVLYEHLRQYRLLPATARPEGKGDPAAGSSVRFSTAVTDWLAQASMSEIENLARRAVEERRAVRGQGELGEWLDRALGRGHPEVPRVLDEAGSRGRAVLLAVAFLEGARIDSHSAAVERLLPIVRTPEETIPPLERVRFTAQLTKAGATIDEDRRVRFSSPGYGHALRSAFWDAYPHLQAEFAAWIDTCATDPELSPTDRDAVAERWAAQALRTHRLRELLERVYRWSSEHGPQAALLLSSALSDVHHGAATRQQVYVWARNRSLPAKVAYVLVAVCEEVLADTHPDQALVRLHHLADNAEPDAAEAARSALSRLADDPAMYRRLLRRVSNKLAGPDRRDREIDRILFWELTSPARLVGDDRPQAERRDVAAWTTAGLPVALSRDPRKVAHYCERLLAHPRPLPDFLVDQLVAAARDTGRLSSLYVAALRWPRRAGAEAGDPALRQTRTDHLLSRIDAAQGLDLSPPSPPRKESTP